MADDTRQAQVREALTLDPSAPKAFTGQQWGEAQAQKPPENANTMPGGTANTAGGQIEDPTFVDAVQSIKADDWSNFARKPCVRDSLLTGIGAGFAVGSMRAIWRTPIAKACNWAVGTACLSSIAMYQYCNMQRLAEKEGMKRAMEIMDRKQIERRQKEARMERVRELRRQRQEEEQDAAFARLGGEKQQQDGKPWYKGW